VCASLRDFQSGRPRRKLPSGLVQRFRAANFELAGGTPTPFELDGEWVGYLPVAFPVGRERLRVFVS
jgi:diacylglycerol kinase family enzyme